MAITILKDHRCYEFITSQQYKTSMTLTIKYDNTQECVFFIPVEDKLTDVTVTNSMGRVLPHLSPKELWDKFGIDLDDLPPGAAKQKRRFERIPILVLPSDSRIEVLSITFVSPLDPKKYLTARRSPNMWIKFGFRITPGEFAIDSKNHVLERSPYDLHVTFKAGSDYAILNHTKVRVDPPGDSQTIEPKKDMPNLLTFYVKNADFDCVVDGMITVGIAESTSNAAFAISIAGVVIPMFLVAGQIITQSFFTPTLEILGGIIALLIGSRIWIIQDKYIMRRWVDIQHGIIILNVVMFLGWFVFWMSKVVP